MTLKSTKFCLNTLGLVAISPENFFSDFRTTDDPLRRFDRQARLLLERRRPLEPVPASAGRLVRRHRSPRPSSGRPVLPVADQDQSRQRRQPVEGARQSRLRDLRRKQIIR